MNRPRLTPLGRDLLLAAVGLAIVLWLLTLNACGPSSLTVEQTPPVLEYGEASGAWDSDNHFRGRLYANGWGVIMPWQLAVTVDIFADTDPSTQSALWADIGLGPIPGLPQILSIHLIVRWSIEAGEAEVCLAAAIWKACLGELPPPAEPPKREFPDDGAEDERKPAPVVPVLYRPGAPMWLADDSDARWKGMPS